MAWLEAQGVTRRFGSIEVLRGVDLEMERGAHALILGPSGSGKSTLLHLFAGLMQPDSGTIHLDGEPLGALPNAAAFRLANIGILFQEFHLLEALTIRQNLSLVADACPPGEALPTPEELMEPLGLHKRLDDRVHTLSRGERQRVALGRAFANRPRLVLADEPTASLDPDNREKSMALFFTLCERLGSTAIVVTHDPLLNAEGQFKSVARLEKGRLVTD